MAPKTTSETGSDRSRARGFTLFEILIVLAIIALFTSFFLLRFDDGAAEEALSEASAELKGAALKAKRRAYAFRRNQYIVFSKSGFVLTERPPVADSFGAPPPPEREGSRVYREAFRLPSGVATELYPAGATKPVNAPLVVWSFRASGLNDPFTVRFVHDRSYARLQFNVLTATANEEMVVE